ncbi:hypothetical protein FA15DRAFT_662620 [Coprinopsis marcescibilis]|uniref:Defect at low temperature protein 1 n=1 Tax=Coprinopsis marcescibilis TaxID=230819 RepID=A0A5C3LFF3_COPMA|nr:hypothetical protein FA15DRAFT_662620 [Coprinopsis marcescibilis]
MSSIKLKRTLSQAVYLFLVLITVVASGLSCAAIISQAVRTADNRSWVNNFNALTVGAAYILVLIASLFLCIQRRIAVRLKLQRISKTYRTVGAEDLPKSVHQYVTQEYVRACLISHESLPKDIVHEGWGRPGTKYSGIYIRRALLNTISRIDTLAHTVIPMHPKLKPNTRMLLHFRFLVPLLSKDQDGMSPLHYYDSAIQLARNADRELTEEEFELGMHAAKEIEKGLEECRLEMSQDSIGDSVL